MECKSEKVLFFFNVTNRFILTIWNVNKLFPKKSLFLSTSFILTICNVNTIPPYCNASLTISFILTICNINVFSY